MSKSSYPQGYRTVPTPGNPRHTEAWALTEAARRMKEAAQSDPLDLGTFLQAVRLNWRLWTIFQAEMSSPDCKLPVEIRQNMIALCNFVDKTAVDIISDPHPSKVNVLININREIASGLLAQPPGAAEPVGGTALRPEAGPAKTPAASNQS
jgi:flagellar protein FlaF